ncbi:hypothetical protein [Bradyrhizobium sp. UNPA324]|nr:hypothetical protein [Bradyrhizobium sp. UNPA324]
MRSGLVHGFNGDDILLGQYDAAGFQTEADKNTGTLISYHDYLV